MKTTIIDTCISRMPTAQDFDLSEFLKRTSSELLSFAQYRDWILSEEQRLHGNRFPSLKGMIEA